MKTVSSYSVVIILNFLLLSLYGANKNWTGNTNSDWNTASNWSGGTLPSNNDNIFIDPSNYTGAASLPIISTNSLFQPGDITVSNGGVLTINANLTTQGNIIFDGNTGPTLVTLNSGTFNMTGLNKQITITNEATFNINGGNLATNKEMQIFSGGQVNVNFTATVNIVDKLTVKGKKTLQSSFNLISGTVSITGLVELDGGNAGTKPRLIVSGGNLTNSSGIYFKGNSSDNPTVQVSGGIVTNNGSVYNNSAQANMLIDCRGGAIVFNSSLSSQNANTDTIKQSGGVMQFNGSNTWTLSGNLFATGGEIVFNGITSFSSSNANLNFYNLTINSGKTMSMGGSVNSIYVAKNWYNDNGTFTHNNKKITLNGNSSQIVTNTTGTETFYDLVINNTGTVIPQIIFNNKIKVTNSLTMTKGNIFLNNDSLILGTSISSNGTLIYIDGWMYGGNFKRWFSAFTISEGNVKGLFPMGGDAKYYSSRPLYVSIPSSAPASGGTINVKHIDDSTAIEVSIMDDVLLQVRHNSNWQITTTGITGGTYNLKCGGTNYNVSDINHLRMSLVNSCCASPGTNAGPTTNPLVQRTGLSLNNLNNSFFISSSNPTTSPLPVSWLDFRVERNEKSSKVFWSTSSEINNDYFSIERSRDFQGIETIGRVKGAGNSNTEISYSFTDTEAPHGDLYYRLKQTDYDGKFEYSDWVRVEASNTEYKFDVFPNPSHKGQNLNLRFENNFNEEILVIVMDILGKEYFSKVFISESNNQIFAIDPLENLTPGIYIVTGSNKNWLFSKKLVVK